MTESRIYRRWFGLVAGSLGLLAATGCNLRQTPRVSAAAPTATDMTTMPGMTPSTSDVATPTAAVKTVRQKADEMDAMHEAKMKLFPAKTEGVGNQPLAFKLDGTTKVFELTASRINWEVTPGQKLEAWVYNNQLPGPEIRVTEGDHVRINLTNQLEESTAIHWHGLNTPNGMDGVPFITQPPIKPGDTFTYEFVAKPAGSHMYHSHHNSARQVSMGLLGAFIVEPKDPTSRPAFDIETTLILNDGPQCFTFNGKSFPATAPITAKLGQRVLIRYMNEGMMIHPMHLHGMPMQVVAKDGYLLPQPYHCDTLNVAPGDRWEVIVTADNPGVWAFHCHILPHAEAETGMFGMVTALIVGK
jgi:FtsP/CotA-like multicopper oxidase with cupredoxin domain